MKKALVVVAAFVASPVLFAGSPNYDESKVEPYHLESPVEFADGTPLKSASEWPKRRAEIVDIFAREMYGRIPPKPEALVTELEEEGPTFAGLGLRKQYRMWFKADKSGPSVRWLVVVPTHAKAPVPPILMLNYGGNHEMLNDEQVILSKGWLKNSTAVGITNHQATAKTRGCQRRSENRSGINVGQLLARGYGFMTACYGDISPDPDFRKQPELFWKVVWTGVFSLWPENDPTSGDNITSLGAWAWGLSRGLDLAERIPEIDATRAVVTGCSRLGKAALLAASRDERFKVCVPNQTGGGGAPLSKRNYGENLTTEKRSFPHWYCNNYWKYEPDPQTMPFDQHLLLASIAPRALLIEGFNKGWFDTKGEYLSCKAASAAWEFLGQPGLPKGDFPESFDEGLIGERLGYVRREGEHGLSDYDWKWLLDFADRALGKGRK